MRVFYLTTRQIVDSPEWISATFPGEIVIYYFGNTRKTKEDAMNLAEELVALMRASGMKCATAESCTGGGIAAAITDVPGSSEVFLGGVVSYANSAKEDVLGVAPGILARFGAVSPECASEMADGARRLLKADVAVSVTGIAGPGGGSEEKPVGLVWFGLSSPSGTRTEKAIFPGDRAAVRRAAVAHALGMLSAACV